MSKKELDGLNEYERLACRDVYTQIVCMRRLLAVMIDTVGDMSQDRSRFDRGQPTMSELDALQDELVSWDDRLAAQKNRFRAWSAGEQEPKA